MKCLTTCNERQRRQFLASKAGMLGYHGVSRVCEATGVSRSTLRRGRRELDNDANDTFPKGRIRAIGGGRTQSSRPRLTQSILTSLMKLQTPIRLDCHKTTVSCG